MPQPCNGDGFSIDEISMVSAELLARLELRCRELVRDISARKFASNRGEARCFGGLNVCFSGDLWQLPPPRGTFLGEVPWEMITKGSNKKLALTIHGQELLWAYGGHGIQGMTELFQCERTHDEWLQELQEQLRHGELSDENHAFLHGRITKSPGSVCKGRVTCGQAKCQRLMQQQSPASVVWAQECIVCKRERASKALVLDGKRVDACVAEADAILPTNAVKYHVNKLRAQEWAKRHQERIRYAIGQDRISSAALREKARLNKRKIGMASKARSGMWGLVRSTSYLHGSPSPRHRPHRQSKRYFAWVSRGGSRMVARTRDRKL